MRLDRYDNEDFERGSSRLTEALWLLMSGFFSSDLPGSGWRRWLLRRFGARIGTGVVLKPGVKIKFPWRLRIGDHVWIGERVWIDNLAQVTLGNHVCISQGAYFCTGSHDWSREDFRLIVKPIAVRDHAWICAAVNVAPGALVECGAVVTMGSLVHGRLASWTVHSGIPASPVCTRVRHSSIPGEGQE